MNPSFIFRPETPDDYAEVEVLTREAFWNVYQPGCVEHYLLHVLRGDPAVVEALNQVCVLDGEIIGHIFFTRARVIDAAGNDHPLLSFGPISVRPTYQRQGIGSRLIESSLAPAAALGFDALAIEGNPAYYGRFGFRPASAFGITAEDGSSFDALMALPLRPGGLDGISGRLIHPAAFSELPAEAVDAFDARFPGKEKLRLPGQLR